MCEYFGIQFKVRLGYDYVLEVRVWWEKVQFYYASVTQCHHISSIVNLFDYPLELNFECNGTFSYKHWWTYVDQQKVVYLKILKYSFEFIVRTEMTCDTSKYESWDTGSAFTSAEILDSIYNDLDLGLWELLIKHLH